MFLSDTVKLIVLIVIGGVFALSRLALAYPHIDWLQHFKLPVPKMSEEQKARRRRSANRMAALEMILAGLALPALYLVSSIMLFSEPKTLPTIIVLACSIVLIGLGIWVFVRGR